jgi:hypothetical protein
MPKLKLRVKIVGAAALVFVMAIASSLFYVVSSSRLTMPAPSQPWLTHRPAALKPWLPKAVRTGAPNSTAR